MRGGWILVGWIVLGVAMLRPAAAQDPASEAGPEVRWRLVADGRALDWAPEGAPGEDSLRHVAAEALEHLRREGYYYAALDSTTVDSTQARPLVQLYASRGPEVPVGEVHLEGVAALDSVELARALETRAGRPLDPDVLEADVQYLLRRYEQAGYPLARVRLEELDVIRTGEPALNVTLRVEEGRQLRLHALRLPGARRTRPGYVMRLAGLRQGMPLQGYRAEDVRRRLAATGFFEDVGTPELEIGPDDRVTLVVPVEERPPGSFDLVLGYQPDPAGGGGQLVGSGHLLVHNMLGGGREGELQLHRLPGQASRVRARIADPYLVGLPFGAEVSFAGVQQDSSYNQVQYRAALNYRLTPRLSVNASLSRELTRPGVAGARLDPRSGTQHVPRSDVLFAGAGVRYERIDRRVNPRRGLLLEAHLERGLKQRYARRRTADGDTTANTIDLTQERLTFTARAFVPTLRRQVLALGADARLLRSDEYDRGDLFRFGGATTLRGYDEDRFLGSAVGRLLAEYRYLLDRRSYAYAFYDLGYVRRPELADDGAQSGYHPGYGIGLQFETPLGLVNASYAVSPEDHLAEGRVHVGLSFGL